MKFDQRQWVNDMAVGALTGALTGAVAGLLVPTSTVGLAATVGGVVGFLRGLSNHPLRWLLEMIEGHHDSDEK